MTLRVGPDGALKESPPTESELWERMLGLRDRLLLRIADDADELARELDFGPSAERERIRAALREIAAAARSLA